MSVKVRLLYHYHNLRKMPSQLLPIYLAPPTSSPRSVAAQPPSKKGGEEILSSSSDDELASGRTRSRFDDEMKVVFEPLIGRASFSTAAGDENSQRQRGRRSGGGGDLESGDGVNGQQGTVGEEVEHVAEETYLVTRLGLRLIGYLGY